MSLKLLRKVFDVRHSRAHIICSHSPENPGKSNLVPRRPNSSIFYGAVRTEDFEENPSAMQRIEIKYSESFLICLLAPNIVVCGFFPPNSLGGPPECIALYFRCK